MKECDGGCVYFEVLAKILIFLQLDQNPLELLLKDNSYFRSMSYISRGFDIVPINYDKNDFTTQFVFLQQNPIASKPQQLDLPDYFIYL